MTFDIWLHQQVDRKDLVGDLACDARGDAHMPLTVEGWNRRLRGHKHRMAHAGAMQALTEFELLRKGIAIFKLADKEVPQHERNIIAGLAYVESVRRNRAELRAAGLAA